MPDQREPLWASSLAEQPERYDDVFVSVVEETPAPASVTQPSVPAAKASAPLLPARTALGLALLAGLAVLAIATASGPGSFRIADIPSAWEEIPMRCHTARLEQSGHAVELLRCHALGDGTLPPGVYRSPDSLWTSDITRVDAVANAIRISSSGRLTGWAVY